MKNTKKIAFALVASFIIFESSVAMAFGNSANVEITGEIVSNTCTVDKTTVPVDLGRVSVNDFSSANGSTAGLTAFTVTLKDCGEDTTSVLVSASGTKDDADNEAFKLNNTDGAQGVAVLIKDEKQRVLIPNDESSTSEYSIQPQKGENDLQFYAEYVKTGEIKTGAANTSATLNIDYK